MCLLRERARRRRVIKVEAQAYLPLQKPSNVELLLHKLDTRWANIAGSVMGGAVALIGLILIVKQLL
jgi:hypothetical protein